ncbi:hypothetical protein [Kocuria sp.]|uniref:hypothetical protein n=1 Tax=Kocuria sp. TaxID=1871328 RepID=UPI0026E0ABF4|nr:hypothetical protein [Kocuria sp.]MDO5617292.1 hypothetical protein [Kocuria sp.]
MTRWQLERDPTMIWLPAGYWMRCPRGMDPNNVEPWELAAVLQPRFGPRVAVAHASAAHVWKIPLSQGMEWVDQLLGEPIRPREVLPGPHFAYAGSRRNQSSRTFVMHKSLGLPFTSGPWDIQVTHPVETLVSMHHHLMGWRGVAAMDHVLSTGLEYLGGPGCATPEEVAGILDQLPHGTRGLARTRRALELAVPNVWSPMETVLRLLLVHLGFPVPETNTVLELPSGRRAIIDLTWAAKKVGVEYNGEIHYRDRKAYGDEMYRLHQLQDMGWKIRLVVAEDLRDPYRRAQLVRWLAEALSV